MRTHVKFLSGDKFNPHCSNRIHHCFRCGKKIFLGEYRMDFGSMVTSKTTNNEAEVSWETFCETCASGLIASAKKVESGQTVAQHAK